MLKFGGQKSINYRYLQEVRENAANEAEGCRRVFDIIGKGIENFQNESYTGTHKIDPAALDYASLAAVYGLRDGLSTDDQVTAALRRAESDLSQVEDHKDLFVESNVAISSHAFQLTLGRNIHIFMADGFDQYDSGMVGDQLVTVQPTNSDQLNGRVVGLTAVPGPERIEENQPYPEGRFGEKWHAFQASKYGRILSFTKETMWNDPGQIRSQAQQLGRAARRHREKLIIQGVQDMLGGDRRVFRPQGKAMDLYPEDGSLCNYIGPGNTTHPAFNTVLPFASWQDLDKVLQYRSKVITDDRIDGDRDPIIGINNTNNILLVPQCRRSAAFQILNGTQVRTTSPSGFPGQTDTQTLAPNPVRDMVSTVLDSVFLTDEDTYYYGDFRSQFLFMDVWPLALSFQFENSESSFERDVVYRIKASYAGAVAATDNRLVTKVALA